MTAKSLAARRRTVGHRRLLRIGGAALVVLVVAVSAGAPFLFEHGTLQSEVATQVRATTGFEIAADHATFNLLPRPHVSMTGIRLTDPAGLVRLDAERLNGEVRLLPLVVGRIELSAATLQKPRLAIDLDGRPMAATSTIGRAMRTADPSRTAPDQRLGTITFVGGTITIGRGAQKVWPAMTNVDATVDWRDLDSPATLTGSLRVAGLGAGSAAQAAAGGGPEVSADVSADVSAWVAQPSRLMRGDLSAIVLRIRSAPLDLSANGSLAGVTTADFKGRVTASSPSLAALLALAAPGVALPAPFADTTLDCTATARFGRDGMGSIDLQDLVFRADGNEYEGTVAYLGAPRPLVSGTLAVDRLNLAPFMARLPALLDADRKWAQAAPPPLRLGSVDLDMRFSAAHIKGAPYGVDDAALSVMTRGDRLEIGLNEGKAYGGAAKGRVSIGDEADGLNVRVTGTMTGADLGLLGWDALGRQVATGTLSGSANLETTGRSVAALAANLQGWGKGRVSDGEVFGFDLGRELRDSAQTPPQAATARTRGGSTAFSDMLLDFRVAGGLATIEEATMRGPTASTNLAGTVDVGARTLDLHAGVAPPKAGADAAPALAVDLRGGFDKVVVAPRDRGTDPTGVP